MGLSKNELTNKEDYYGCKNGGYKTHTLRESYGIALRLALIPRVDTTTSVAISMVGGR